MNYGSRYVSRIEECATWPGGLIAHHYTRYLGDRAKVLDEVLLAYQLNIDVLDDLGRALEEAR